MGLTALSAVCSTICLRLYGIAAVLTVYVSFCVVASLPYMSIGAGVVVAVTFQQVDDTPDTKTSAQSDNESLKYRNCAVEKCHIVVLLSSDKIKGIGCYSTYPHIQ